MPTVTRYYFPNGSYTSSNGAAEAGPWTTFYGVNSYGARIAPVNATSLGSNYMSCSGITTESNRFMSSFVEPAVAGPTSYPGGLFRAAFLCNNWQGTQGTKRLAMMVRHTDAAGVIKGTPVMDMTYSAYVPGSGWKVATVSGVLRAVTLAAGDRLAIELGANAYATGGGQALQAQWGTPASTPDLAFADGNLSAGVPWAEIEWQDPIVVPKMYVGSTKINQIYLGATNITKAFLGGNSI